MLEKEVNHLKSPKLPLTTVERSYLRGSKVTLKEICNMDVVALAHCLQSSIERAKYIHALAEFQSIPSIGPKVAEAVIQLGYYSLIELKDEDGADLLNRLELLCGHWKDPCVEDCLRCIVFYANHPDCNKSWWNFTTARKEYRAQYGYPSTRPALPWHEGKNI